jgi:DNA replication protein DnaC
MTIRTDKEALIALAGKLGERQREVVLALTGEWGKALCHRAAKRLLWNEHNIVDHKHRTDNCWRLNAKGAFVQSALRSQATTLEGDDRA